jgi:hypothetical protein
VPILRPGLRIEAAPGDFDNPFLDGRGVAVATSGSRGVRTRVSYDWNLMAEHAASELLLNHIHSVDRAPLALWLPTPPSVAGIHHLLLNLKARRPPERWFSQVGVSADSLLARTRLGLEFVLLTCRLLGHRVPRPESAGPADAGRVADWMVAARTKHGRCLLRTYTSAAVRVARAARERGLDLEGCLILTGGEPLTSRRRDAIEASGAAVFPRYSATEAGLIGAACDRRQSSDDMHLHMDRLAVVPLRRVTSPDSPPVDAFLFTSLTPHMGKVLLNTDIGDFGRLEDRPCTCTFGELGMSARLSQVRSHDKLNGEGMSLLGSELDEIIAGLVERAGGGPDDYQFWESEDEQGLPRLVVAVSPRVRGLDQSSFLAAVLQGVGAKPQGGGLAARIWRDSNTLQLVREEPLLTRGHKLLSLTRDPRP